VDFASLIGSDDTSSDLSGEIEGLLLADCCYHIVEEPDLGFGIRVRPNSTLRRLDALLKRLRSSRYTSLVQEEELERDGHIMVHDAKAHLSRLLERVAQGEEIIIVKNASRRVTGRSRRRAASFPRIPETYPRMADTYPGAADRLPGARIGSREPRIGFRDTQIACRDAWIGYRDTRIDDRDTPNGERLARPRPSPRGGSRRRSDLGGLDDPPDRRPGHRSPAGRTG
jgi:antitoxin (DNA-binding transcriptional repressor) of toxin-antitoxin stability system